MPDFPIQLRAVDYQTDRGHTVRAKRGYLLYEPAGLPIICDAFLDTAAPFGVVPYTLSRHLSWSRIAANVTRAGRTATSALTWQGIACDLGTISFRCVHVATGVRSHVLQMTAKFPRLPAALALESAVVLGMSLFDENPVRLVFDNVAGTLCGHPSIS
jgi:hypothetical protein